jgi:hypothetical protein
MINGLEFGDLFDAMKDAWEGRPVMLNKNQANTIMMALRKMYDEPAEPKVEIVYTDEWGQKEHYPVGPTHIEHREYGDIVEYNIDQKISTVANRRSKEGLR